MNRAAAGAGLLLFLWWSGCSVNEESGCEDAKREIQPIIKEICGEPAYKGSPFCECCVPAGLYSVDNDCACRDLVFDSTVCFYATDDEARAQVRSAVQYANEICSVRKPRLPYGDAGDACRPPEMPATSVTDAGATEHEDPSS